MRKHRSNGLLRHARPTVALGELKKKGGVDLNLEDGNTARELAAKSVLRSQPGRVPHKSVREPSVKKPPSTATAQIKIK